MYVSLMNAWRDSLLIRMPLHLPYTQVRETVGPTGKVIGAVSGGVDSSVAAVLLNRAIGDRFHAVMVGR